MSIDLTGKTIKQIMDLDIDINKLSRGDLSRVVGRLVSASNKRIRSLAKTELGRMAPAYQSRMQRGGEFSTRGLNTNQLRQLFGETKGFLQLKTSSIRGWGNVRKQVTELLGVDKTFLNTKTKERKFWKAYREITEGKNIPDNKTRSRYNSERIQELIAERFSQRGGFRQKRSDIVEDVTNRIDKLYEQEQRDERSFDKPSSEIDMDDEYEGLDI